MTKMTRVQALEMAIGFAQEKGEQEMVDVLTKVKASISREGAVRKPTKNQIANEAIKENILNYLAGTEKATVKDIALYADGCNDLSSQKITALVTAMCKDNKVVRSVDKKVAYFSVA